MPPASSQSHQQTQPNSLPIFHKTFLAHPTAIGESYFEHQRAALGYAVKFLWLASAAMLHALIPALCERTARDEIEKLHEELQTRSAKPSSDKA